VVEGRAHSDALGAAVGAGREPGEDPDHRLVAPHSGSKLSRAERRWPLFLFAGSTGRCVAVIDLSRCFFLFINLISNFLQRVRLAGG
jgi:hypothetical protein